LGRSSSVTRRRIEERTSSISVFDIGSDIVLPLVTCLPSHRKQF
jgi:hypothetical protein